MRSRIFIASGLSSLLFCMVLGFVPNANATSHQSANRPVSITTENCEMSEDALEAINRATAEFVKQGSKNAEANDLIEAAKNAGWPPECDSVRAKILADKALDALGVYEQEPGTLPVLANEEPTFTRFDGPWSIGLNMEFVEQEGIRSTDFFDSLVDDKYGLQVGKEFYRTDNWLLGGQLHIIKTNDVDVDDPDEISFDSTSLFATARYESLPALQFKIGVSRVDYENFYDEDTETGLVYGIGLTTGNDDIRVHWLDYEVHQVGNEEFETISVNLLVILCVVGMFAGGDCF